VESIVSVCTSSVVGGGIEPLLGQL
jgi:hypothetical protein